MRVIAATNRNLREMIKQGTFREDLFYRLNVIHIVVPPLRDRREDIPVLVDQFLSQFTADNRSSITSVSPDAMKALTEYSWPGNVRELENVIERLVVTVQRHRRSKSMHLSSEIRVAGRVSRCGPSVSAAGPSPTTSTSACSSSTSRSGRRCIRCSWIGKSRARTCAKSSGAGSRKRAATTRSWRVCSTWKPRDYKRFLNFLRKHDCQIPFKEYR